MCSVMRTLPTLSCALALGAFAGCTPQPGTGQTEQGVSGATFTTLPDGSAVDANIYASKDDVYLDGGPSANAPSKAAALPAEGDD